MPSSASRAAWPFKDDDVIDLADFYAQLGAPQSPGQDEQLILQGDVRVQVTASGWTAFFEGIQADGVVLVDAFAISRQPGAPVPFLTRSGYLGMKWQSPSSMPDTSDAVRALQVALRQMVGS